MKKELTENELIKAAKEEKLFYTDLKPRQILEEFVRFVDENQLTVDFTKEVPFKHIYWEYIKWRGGERGALSRIAFGSQVGAYFPQAGTWHNRRFHVGPWEKFNYTKEQLREFRKFHKESVWRVRKKRQLNRKLVKQGILKLNHNGRRYVRTPEYLAWQRLVKKVGKEQAPSFQHFRKNYTPRSNKNTST